MQTILISAYAVHPHKGSEDGMGWRFILEAVKNHRVIAITRENNAPAIETFLSKNHFEGKENLRFEYFDLPRHLRFWKRGGRFSSLYHVLWHRAMPDFVRRKKLQFDVAHHLNFHCDWTPAHLWRLGKPFVWGPVGHHPQLPADYLRETGGWAALFSDRLSWFCKKMLWQFSPGLRDSVRHASTVFGMNSAVSRVLDLEKSKVQILPSVGTDPVFLEEKNAALPQFSEFFKVLFVGRFVRLKGPETVLRSFARFFKNLDTEQQRRTRLQMVGRGPLRSQLEVLAQKLDIAPAVEWTEWLPFETIGEVYQKTSVFFFPSHEGAGMVVAEALAHGVPVLCYANEGPGELTDDSCAVRVPYRTHREAIEQFAQALHSLWENPEKRRAMRDHAVRFQREKLSWSGKAAFLSKAYAEAAAA